jgi:hypothetical protein
VGLAGVAQDVPSALGATDDGEHDGAFCLLDDRAGLQQA